jgi:hypothetical protein
MKYLYALMGD